MRRYRDGLAIVGIVIFARFPGRALNLDTERIFSTSILYSNMQSSKIFSFLLVAGLILASCKKSMPAEGQAGADQASTTADAGASAGAAADNLNIEVPPFSADMVSQAVQACDRMSNFINDQLMTKEYELSKAAGDALLTEQVAKLKEYQVGFSQMKDKIRMSTAETWPGLYTEYQKLGIAAKTYLKAMMQ
jgi:hypothetical protein